jgi:hypothetical protein
MWCCKRMKIRWTYLVKNKDVLHRVKEEKNVMYDIKRRKNDWIYKF